MHSLISHTKNAHDKLCGWIDRKIAFIIVFIFLFSHLTVFIWFLDSYFVYETCLNRPCVFSGWLGAVSIGISLLFSPIWVSICKRKSTRLAAVFGGLIASLGCLFTSFASQFHQLFISYGAFLGMTEKTGLLLLLLLLVEKLSSFITEILIFLQESVLG